MNRPPVDERTEIVGVGPHHINHGSNLRRGPDSERWGPVPVAGNATGTLDRRVGLLGFPEFNNASYEELRPQGLEVFDIEVDAGSFDIALPRIRIIPLDEFDPVAFL